MRKRYNVVVNFSPEGASTIEASVSVEITARILDEKGCPDGISIAEVLEGMARALRTKYSGASR